MTPQADRQQALDRFRSDEGISTLLMTIGTGALGYATACSTALVDY